MSAGTHQAHWAVHGHVQLLPNRLHERAARLDVHTQAVNPVADGAAHVVLECTTGPFVLVARMGVAEARGLAGLLLEGADAAQQHNAKQGVL